MTTTILIADDEEAARVGLSRALERLEGCRLLEARDGDEALKLIRSERPELVFLDLGMPGRGGDEVLGELVGEDHGAEIVVVTADDAMESAIHCMRLGAADYLTKPYEVERVRSLARRVIHRVALERRVEELSGNASRFGELVGASRSMRTLFARIERAAAAPLPVLVRGETGTGKELVAREIHRRSARAKGPFVAVNVAAVTESLAESELFGHRRGAFTGAEADRRGCFEEAHGGTLFLDEIGDMPTGLQAKILRSLQEGIVQPVGSSERRAVDVRVVSATHQDLESSMEEGGFRRDLYYRLKGIELVVPPLRERQEDILLLGEHFLERYAAREEGTPLRLGSGVAARLLAHPWPGNVRELEQLVCAAAALAEGELLSVDDLGLAPASPSEEAPDLEALAALPLTEAKQTLVAWFEERCIRRALEESGDNVSEAARRLGIHRQSLQSKMNQLGIRRGK